MFFCCPKNPLNFSLSYIKTKRKKFIEGIPVGLDFWIPATLSGEIHFFIFYVISFFYIPWNFIKEKINPFPFISFWKKIIVLLSLFARSFFSWYLGLSWIKLNRNQIFFLTFSIQFCKEKLFIWKKFSNRVFFRKITIYYSEEVAE